MTHKIRFTAEGPMSKFETLEDLMVKEGYKVLDVKLLKRGEKVMPPDFHRNTYKKPAMEMVYEALSGNKGTGITVQQLRKAMDMPTGTISGSLAKLQKLGRIEKLGGGKWKAR